MKLDFIEGVTVEFKRAGDGAKADASETICAFLNRYGGELFLGVADNGDMIGFPEERAEEIVRQLIKVAKDPNLMDPPFVLFPEKRRMGNVWIVRLQVPQSSQVHRWKGVCYDRANEADVTISSSDAIAQMYIRKQHVFTEQKVYPLVTIKDLRTDLLPKVRNLTRIGRDTHPCWRCPTRN